MIILLGSKNPSKKKSLESALQTMDIKEYEIISYDAKSGVNSKPIGYEIIRGALNRNQELKEFALKNNIQYDYLCSIEGGFSKDENGLPFVVTYCIIENKSGKKSTGKSLGIRITKTMFDYLEKGGSLNKIIEEITKETNNKQKLGITGYLSNGICNRTDVDKEAVLSGFLSFIYNDKRMLLDEYILKNKRK